MMGRCPYKVGISESGTKVVKRTAKKRMPPREKKAEVLSGNLKNTVPMITDMSKKELGGLNNGRGSGEEGGLTEPVRLVQPCSPSGSGSVER